MIDLRKFQANLNVSEDELMTLWWYQPFIFSDDIITGASPQWFMKGLDTCIARKSDLGRSFDRFWEISTRTAKMYQDWGHMLTDISGVNLSESSVFEIGCNTGGFLFWFKGQGAKLCVGIDKSDDLDKQRSILQKITGMHDVDFRDGGWSSITHSINGLTESEQFDLVIATAVTQHISDPLHMIKELSDRTRKALLIHTWAGRLNFSMNVRYMPAPHHAKWGDVFPNDFDTQISRKLLDYSLRQCGFTKIIQIPYSRKWLPRSWYRSFSTLICIKE